MNTSPIPDQGIYRKCPLRPYISTVPADRVKDRMANLEEETAELIVQVEASSAHSRPPSLLPEMGDLYRAAVTNLCEVLDVSPDRV